MDGHIWTSPRGINPVIWSSRLYPASSRRESTTGQLTLAPPTSQWIISNSMLKVLRHSEKRSRTESHLPSRTPICSRNISMWPQSHNRDTHLTHSSLSHTLSASQALSKLSVQMHCLLVTLIRLQPIKRWRTSGSEAQRARRFLTPDWPRSCPPFIPVLQHLRLIDLLSNRCTPEQ